MEDEINYDLINFILVWSEDDNYSFPEKFETFEEIYDKYLNCSVYIVIITKSYQSLPVMNYTFILSYNLLTRLSYILKLLNDNMEIINCEHIIYEKGNPSNYIHNITEDNFEDEDNETSLQYLINTINMYINNFENLVDYNLLTDEITELNINNIDELIDYMEEISNE